jgi:hypothetical protein
MKRDVNEAAVLVDRHVDDSRYTAYATRLSNGENERLEFEDGEAHPDSTQYKTDLFLQ